MITQMEGLPAGTLGFRASGRVTARDYEQVVVPDVEAAFALNRKLRLVTWSIPISTASTPPPCGTTSRWARATSAAGSAWRW